MYLGQPKEARLIFGFGDEGLLRDLVNDLKER